MIIIKGEDFIEIDDKHIKLAVEAVKVKIYEAIKHHIKKGYRNRRIVMTKQHSYVITNGYDYEVLKQAVNILSDEFKLHNIPISVYVPFLGELDLLFTTIYGGASIPIAFTINK